MSAGWPGAATWWRSSPALPRPKLIAQTAAASVDALAKERDAVFAGFNVRISSAAVGVEQATGRCRAAKAARAELLASSDPAIRARLVALNSQREPLVAEVARHRTEVERLAGIMARPLPAERDEVRHPYSGDINGERQRRDDIAQHREAIEAPAGRKRIRSSPAVGSMRPTRGFRICSPRSPARTRPCSRRDREPPRCAAQGSDVEYLSEATVEAEFGAGINVLHEAAHAVTAVLLGLPLAAVTADPRGGVTAVLHERGNPDHVRRLATVWAVAGALMERCHLSQAWCQDDHDNVTCLEAEYTRLTGSFIAPWSAARAVVREPSFGVAMSRLVPVLRDRGTVTGAEVVALLADLPRLAV